MRTLFLLAFVPCIAPTSLLAQVTGVSVETYYTDDGTIADYPAGHATYRIYADLTHATDRLTAVYGDIGSPLFLSASGSGIWNHPAAGATAYDNDCASQSATPAMGYDSFLAIGYTCNSAASAVYALDDPNTNTWISEAFATAPYGMGDVQVTTQVGALWFSMHTAINTEAGNELRVLVAQITTDGGICGTLNFQVFPEYTGPGSTYIEQPGFVFSSPENSVLSIATEMSTPTCFGDEDASIEVEATGGTGVLAYSFDNVTYGSTAALLGIGAGTYHVYVRDEAGCTAAQTVQITDPAGIFATADVDPISCHDSNDGGIHINHTGGTGTLSFSIDGNNYFPSPDFDNLPEGTYQIHVMDANGCSFEPGMNISLVNPEMLEVSGLEAIDITDALPGGNTSYTVEGGVSPYTFQWTDEDDNVVSDSQDLPPLPEQSAAGTYTLTITDDVGCAFITTIEIDFTTSVDELALGYAVEVFPNPTPGSFTLHFHSNGSMNVSYRITDTSGRSILSSNLGTVRGEFHEHIDVSGLVAGIYFLKTEAGSGSNTVRIAKYGPPSAP